jgi:hypothetical protein
MAAKKKVTKSEQRRLRAQQIVLGVIAIMVILSMVIGLISQY